MVTSHHHHLPPEIFAEIISFGDLYDYSNMRQLSKAMNELCLKFMPLDVACKKAYLDQFTDSEFHQLNPSVKYHRSFLKNLLCGQPRKISLLLDEMVSRNHHSGCRLTREDFDFFVYYAIICKIMKKDASPTFSRSLLMSILPYSYRLESTSSSWDVTQIVQKIPDSLSSIAEQLDSRLVSTLTFRQQLLEYSKLIRPLKEWSTKSEKDILSMLTLPSTPMLCKLWFFSLPVLTFHLLENKSLSKTIFEQHLEQEDRTHELLFLHHFQKSQWFGSESDFFHSRFVMKSVIVKKPELFSKLPNSIQNDLLVALPAMKTDYKLFQYLKDEMKKDEQILTLILSSIKSSEFLEFVRKHTTTESQFLSIRNVISNSFKIIDHSITDKTLTNYELLEHASSEIKENEKLLLKCLELFRTCHGYSFLSIRTNHEGAKHCAKLETFYEHHLNKDVLFSRRVVEAWLKISFPNYLKNNFTKFGNDLELIKMALKHGEYGVLRQLPPEMQQNSSLASYLVETKPELFPLVYKLVQNDKETVKKAIDFNPYFFELASEEIRSDVSFVLDYITRNKKFGILKHASKHLLSDTKAMMKLVPIFLQQKSGSLCYFPSHVFSDLEFMSYVIQSDPRYARYLSPFVTNDFLIKLYVKVFSEIRYQDCSVKLHIFWQVLPYNLTQKSFFMEFIPTYPQLIISSPFRSDKEVCEVVIKTDPQYVIFCSIDVVLSEKRFVDLFLQHMKSTLANVYRQTISSTASCVNHASAYTPFYLPFASVVLEPVKTSQHTTRGNKQQGSKQAKPPLSTLNSGIHSSSTTSTPEKSASFSKSFVEVARTSSVDKNSKQDVVSSNKQNRSKVAKKSSSKRGTKIDLDTLRKL
ncbi:hypothetical protein C9374_010050 [Naegleria lovaniensis]|uniref:F-box domain-containing protein n=1 Tax=Naegleria lovaniensis TaxID=51637 RepID=A0AA88GJ11_NAELO|nr:uncharacterized protein C9374_010050 [Naegleria lovaniensis]KAG2375046.1 hypothetical protein C9374_010050 [Naegleria lovaniensis]